MTQRDQKNFDRLFSSEESCRNYLFRIRWPEGFRCPVCSGRKAWINKRNLTICAKCGQQISLTSGTILHGTRKSLLVWFKAIWWICFHKTGTSARDLQSFLGLGSYQTAWAWLQKLRRAMREAEREPLSGQVEISEGLLKNLESHSMHTDCGKNARILAAVEIQNLSVPSAGRIKMRHVQDFSADSLVSFVEENITQGSIVITDNWHQCSALAEKGFIHRTTRTNGLSFLGENSIESLKQWLTGVHRGAVTSKHLQHYLDEFTFRRNLRYKSLDELIHKILLGTTKKKAKPYWQLVGRSRPDRPLYRNGKK